MITYIGAIFLILFILFRFNRTLRLNNSGIGKWTMSLAFSIKFIIGLVFLFIYTVHYGNGKLGADAGEFMRESYILNQVFFSSPVDYFKLLSGFGNSQELIKTYLHDTTHWDAGAQAIINDNRNVLRIHSIIHFFSFREIRVHLLIMSFISLIAVKQLFLGIRHLTIISEKYLFWLLLLIPSVLFWTSGILKEPMMFLGFALFVRALFDKISNTKRYILLGFGLLLLIGFKPYVLISLIPAVAFYGLFHFFSKHKIIFAFVALITITATCLITFDNQRDKVVHLISRKQFDFKNVAYGGLHAYADTCFYFFEPSQFNDLIIKNDSVQVRGRITAAILKHGEIDTPVPVKLDSTGQKWPIYFMNEKCSGYIEMTLINDSFKQMLVNIPEALENSLLRPYINDPGSWLKYPAVVEIWCIMFLLGYSIINRRKINKEQLALIIGIIIFILTLSLMIGWVTPVLGAIVRYRIPSIIGVVIISLILINPHVKLKNRQ